MHEPSKVLIADPDSAVHHEIRTALRSDGYQVIGCYSANEVVPIARNEQPDLILMEAVLPDGDGIMLCQQLRKLTDAPILFLSAKCAEVDKIVGLTAGADDYIAKPFGIGEVVARIKAHIRRRYVMVDRKPPSSDNTVIQLDSLVIDVDRCAVEMEGQPIHLSSKEFKLLVFMAEHPKRVFQLEELYRSVWGYDGLDDFRTVAVHISNLRKKMQKVSSRSVIHNIRGLGYKLEV